MIPKVINYCWFGGKKLPNSVKKNIMTWKKKCPDYQIKRWDETNFDISKNSFTKMAYEKKYWAFVSDFARLQIIFENGGIYLDTDVELLKPLDEVLDNEFFAALQNDKKLCNTGLGFGAEKNNKIVWKMVKKYENLVFSEDNKYRLACPYLNTEVIESLGYKPMNKIFKAKEFTIYPPRYFDPISTVNAINIISDESIAIHHYDASWYSKNSKIKKVLKEIVGEKNIIKIRNYFDNNK